MKTKTIEKNNLMVRVRVCADERLFKKIKTRAKREKISISAVIRSVLCNEFKMKDKVRRRTFIK